jgi:5-methyltetrahydrofolate--homocysteine methyltransferase
MTAFDESILEGSTILLDGGLGTSLMARGLQRGTPPETWNLERPEVVTAVHRAWVDAGSDAVHTNTFGANPIRLARFGLDQECAAINRAGVRLARAARPRFVLADVGPTGEYLPPVGEGELGRWRDAFRFQAKVLSDQGADAFHIETMTDLREARVALEALLSETGGVPVLVSMTFERKRRGWFTIMGDPLVESLRTLVSEGASAAGANCSIASGDMAALMSEALRGVNAPLVAQPNAGAPRVMPDGALQYAQPVEDFAGQMAVVRRSGVALVGGCCGTDERFIAALSDRLHRGGEA